MINQLAIEVYNRNVRKGFYDNLPRNVPEMLALIHSEVSEALEADRKDDKFNSSNTNVLNTCNPDDFKELFENLCKNTFEDELADVMIRVMDLAAYKGIDLEKHIEWKMRYNETREHKHGKKY